MTLVLDASVAGKLYFTEERQALARAVVADAIRAREVMLAPHLLTSEFVNICRRKMRLERAPLHEVASALDSFLALPVQYRADPDIYRQALILTERYSLSGFDAQYVALAQLAGCDLWVDDERLMGALRGRLPFVRRLAGYQRERGSV